MNYNQFKNLSCYEEFEIQCALAGISKVDILKEIGNQIDNYYFFVSDDGIFNWFDSEGNHIENPGILKELTSEHIPLSISKCIIPNSVTSIDDCTFYECNSLKEITIPDSVISIGEYAFYHCKSLRETTIPDSVISIGDNTFRYCISLTSITIPNSIRSIGDGTFYECNSIKEIIFKEKTLEEVKRMGNYPFGIKDENVFKFS